MKKNQEQTTNAATDLKQSIVKTFSNKPKETIKSVDLEDKIELERREAYIEPQTRNLLRRLLDGGDREEIIPTYTSNSGFVYQINQGTTSEDQADTLSEECLENLARLDILRKKFFDSVSSCPNCESIFITFHNRCPRCKSHNVQKTSLTEHIPCGYIDQKDKYIDDRCPKCGEILLEGQARSMGRWYVCKECDERFENPEFDLICRSCNKHFTIKEAHVLEIPKFSLNLARKKEIRQNVASLENIKALLTELGFSIEIPGLTLGLKSGMQHHFSLIAKKQISGQEIVVALDHTVSETEVQASPLILYIYKTSEIKVDIPIFVAIPKLSEVTQKIAQGHNILLIEGSTETPEVLDSIKKEIDDRISQVTQNKADNGKKIGAPKEKQANGNFFGKFLGSKKKST
jgi:predicted RNA-binding Zn-ribbon protein involved in translation (DUF1610 family)